MNNKFKKLSQYLCMVLRHKPEELSLDIDSGGWVSVDKLLSALSSIPKLSITRDELHYLVDNDDKYRYSFKGHDKYIRCNQGHSIKNVNIVFKKYTPDTDLYHGTKYENIDSILKKGLIPNKRLYVHISKNRDTARKVGKRYSKKSEPAILVISKDAPLDFFISDNDVVLCKHVPPEYIKIT
jgi:putative RNA 2'-phosphotransferase